ncbi:MAG: GH92 family glycosyl hydrolase [Muribaculaceae bacterium]|nr:GH92 family glycosyl hydrolase [Muribaculaceae bacterium]
MRKIMTVMFLLSLATVYAGEKELIEYVNPMVGTALKGEGGTAPFVGRPFAMTNFLAQTRENKMGSMAYVYDDDHIMGFLVSHQPTVWMGDYGYVSLMPQTSGKVETLPEKRKLSFSHKQEKSTPAYYSVIMSGEEGDIKSEMSAASRAGLMRFKFPKKSVKRVIIQGINLNPGLSDWCNDIGSRKGKMKGWIKIDTIKNEIIGYNSDRQSAQLGPELPNFKGWFVIKPDKKIKDYGVWSGDTIFRGRPEMECDLGGAFVEFDNKEGENVTFAVGMSFIDLDQARTNMEKELPGFNLEKLEKQTRSEWNDKLAKLQVSTKDEEAKRIFYTALFHCYLFPREFSEDGRYYSAFDDRIHEGTSYNDYSLWDTFRAFHPLMTILEPGLTNEWITSLLQMYKEGGWMPMWPNPSYTNIMIGTHADAVIADAFMKGLRDYDVNLAYEAMRKDGMVPPDYDTVSRYGDRDRWKAFEGRAGASWYHTLGYIPDDRTAESVSRTLEYAFDDWCIAQMARELGHMDDYESLMKWAGNYKNIYNPEKGFMLPRKYDGSWIDLDDNDRHGFTEGSKWTYLFCVLQDIPGMIEMMGGKEKFAAKLDDNFNKNHYCHDNEPGHHYIYLYNYCDRPWETQELVRLHTDINYKNAPDGLNGNDDCGQMSAWYLFSVMGFYPVTPASNMFAIGAPQFEEIQIDRVGDSKPLRIKAKGLSKDNIYVEKVMVDGRQLTDSHIRWDDLMNAEEIVFTMTSEPVIFWN